MLLVYNYVLLKMSTWYSKHVEKSNSILRINNIQCITLVIIVWSVKKCSGIFVTGKFINQFTKPPLQPTRRQFNQDSTSHSISLGSILILSACPRQSSWAISIMTPNLIFYFSKINLYILDTCTYSWATSMQTLFWHSFTLRPTLILSSRYHPSPTHFFTFGLSNLNIFYVFLIPRPQCVLHVRPSIIFQIVTPNNTAYAVPYSVIIYILFPGFQHSPQHAALSHSLIPSLT